MAEAMVDDVQHWQDFFAGQRTDLPGPDLERIIGLALECTTVQQSDSPALAGSFKDIAANRQLAIESARLRNHGLFPSVLGDRPGDILASRLVGNWNIILIQEGAQRFLVFQGVSSSDAIMLPGLNLLIIICHITMGQVKNSLAILSRTSRFFTTAKKATFGGYLVGHSRPYHCFYDGLLGLQAVIEAGELNPEDNLYSKEDEAFVDLSLCLGLNQQHQRLSLKSLNQICIESNIYLLQLGFWFHTRAEDPELRNLAENLDSQLREAALRYSQLGAMGALKDLEKCNPLIWVGITGQKRSWIEQVEGTAELLNSMHERFPKLGVVFDGWTPPLSISDYHRGEIRNDDNIIRSILKKLNWNTRQNIGILTGLPSLEKIRVGLSVDVWLGNYTSGSQNIARICGKPGVGHMGVRMVDSKHQHIHHCTREIPIEFIKDISDASTPTGYVNYSIPWQALYKILLEVIDSIPVKYTQSTLSQTRNSE